MRPTAQAFGCELMDLPRYLTRLHNAGRARHGSTAAWLRAAQISRRCWYDISAGKNSPTVRTLTKLRAATRC